MEHGQDHNPEDDLNSSENPDGLSGVNDSKLETDIKSVVEKSGNEKLQLIKKQALWQHIQHEINAPVETVSYAKRSVLPGWAILAASIVLVISLGIYLMKNPVAPTVSKTITLNKKVFKNVILPGGNKAMLTLADGSKIALDQAQKGLLAKQGKTAISKTDDGQLSYNQGASKTNLSAMNMVTTPRGGQYQIVLPDGTRAWLNASSSLQFPIAFTGKERVVRLTGEAYFEVAKNKQMPFKVIMNGVKVEVLGTHFNVMSYADEPAIKTTLLEGAVKMTNNENQPVLLKPGQQASYSPSDGRMQVKTVNIDNVISWQKGYYVFKAESIKSIMRNISRWYDVEMEYKGNLEGKVFSGKISRYKNISELLKLLELTEDVHFEIKERRVTVMP